jgi:hypothetical protein
MTVYEYEAAEQFDRRWGRGDTWAKIMVPLLTAALVIALGLILVGVTSSSDSREPIPTTQGVSVR